ncbi:phosphatase PAP2 family protein [Tissierellaceae bacterium HCP3S3_D8]
MNKKIHIGIIGFMMAIFFIIGFMVKDTAEEILFDISILEFLHSGTSPIVFKIMKFISFIGSGKFLLPIIGVIVLYLIIKKKYYIAKLLLAGTIGSYSVNFILKILFHRIRPIEFFRVNQSGYSFPSGHSMVSMSMYLMIAYILTRDEDDLKKKRFLYVLSIILVLLMGFSRLYLGVHWPTDVIGGYIVGYIVYYISIRIIKENN